MGSTTENLVEKIFSPEGLWRSAGAVEKAYEPGMYGNVYRMAMLLGFALAAVQLVVIMYNCYRDGRSPVQGLTPLLLKMVLIAALLSPFVYKGLFTTFMCVAPDALAGMLTQTYVTEFLDAFGKVHDQIGLSPRKATSAVTALMNGSLISTWIAGLLFWLAMACVYIMPMLQHMLVCFMFYIGPICCVFSFWDLTSGVARAWLGLTLASTWMAFFGTVTFMVGLQMGLLDGLASATGATNIIATLVYGAMSILLFCSSLPIAAFFFSAASPISGFANPVRAVAGAATAGAGLAVAAGQAGNIAGSVVQRFSTQGGGINRMGTGMRSVSEGLMQMGDFKPGRVANQVNLGDRIAGLGGQETGTDRSGGARSGSYSPNIKGHSGRGDGGKKGGKK